MVIRGVAFLCCCLAAAAVGQTVPVGKQVLSGKVSYKSAENIYVAFESARGIAAGDTLYYVAAKDTLPGILVKFTSSKSAAGSSLRSPAVAIGEVFLAFVARESAPEAEVVTTGASRTDSVLNVPTLPEISRNSGTEGIFGKSSVQAFSTFDNSGYSGSSFTRYRYTLSLYSENYNNSGVSFSLYGTLNRGQAESGIFGNSIAQNLRLYDASLTYAIDTLSKVSVGRYMNPRIASAGAVDGIQYERKFNQFFGGAFVGSRPGMNDYGYDLKLLQYGAYAGRIDEFAFGSMENDLAFFQQMYNGATDRRFLYLQHTNTLLPKTSMFLSSELDLYSREKGVAKNNLSFTGIFYTVRLRPWNTFSVSASYDARKNVLYYESFKSSIDSLVTKELRQGYRVSFAWQPGNMFYLGANGGYRFQPSDPRPSKTAGAYAGYQNVPLIGGALSLNYNNLTGSFLVGNTWALTWYTDVTDGLQCTVSGKKNYYTLPGARLKVEQQLLSVDLSWLISRAFMFNVSYEGTFEQKSSEGRIFSDITFRF